MGLAVGVVRDWSLAFFYGHGIADKTSLVEAAFPDVITVAGDGGGVSDQAPARQ